MSTPDTSAFSIRSWDQLRAFLYVLAPLVIAATVTTHTAEWVGLAAAVLAPALSAINTVDGFRAWFYRVVAAVQLILVAFNVVTQQQITPWLSVLTAVIGGGVAAANVYAPKA